MRAGDLVAVRLEIVNEALAEADLLAQRLLGAGRNMAGRRIVIVDVARPERVILAVFSLGVIAGSGRVTCGAAFDETLMKAEFAVLTDRDDAAGAGAVCLAIDRKTVDRLVDFVAAFLEPLCFGGELVVPLIGADLFEIAEPLLDALDLLGELGRRFGRVRLQADVLGSAPYSRSSTALVQAQSGRSSVAFASSFAIASRRTRAASSMKPSSSPLKRSRVIVPPAAS